MSCGCQTSIADSLGDALVHDGHEHIIRLVGLRVV